MQFTLPDGTPFGNAGDSLYILPQNAYAGTPYVGISAEKLPSGIFNDTLKIQLVRVEGPGQFMLWQSTTFGSFDVRMDTRNGIDSSDTLTPMVGAHEHYNWGFTTNGLYRLYFQASATLAGSTTPITTPITPFTFQIWPLNGFEQWQVTNWPCECATNIIAAGADPDGDRVPNLFEYARGSNPNVLESTPFYSLEITRVNGMPCGSIVYSISKLSTGVSLDVGATSSLESTNWDWLTNRIVNLETETNAQIRVIDKISTTNTAQRFYKMRVRQQ
jgi:surface-anchored protein